MEYTRLGSIWLILFHCSVLPSLAVGQEVPRPPRVTAVVPAPPVAFRASGGMHLVYELRVTNLGGQDVSLTEITVTDQRGEVLQALVGEQLRDNLGTPGAIERAGAFEYQRWVEWQAEYDPTRIEPGMFAVAWMEVVLAAGGPTPRILRHRITVEAEGEATPAVFEAAPTRVSASQLVLEPPVGDGDWLVFGSSNASGHRRALDGFGSISQRFAIDYSKVDEFGSRTSGDPSVAESYHGFGSEVLAVAEGVVIAASDGTEDGPVGRPPRLTPPATRGNFVDLEIAEGVYALYLHLQAGSVLVEPGDTVRSGEVIARLGNSGASASPHLHLQVSASPWAEGRFELNALGEGLPYAHRRFDVLGAAASPYCDCVGPLCEPLMPESRSAEMPVGEVVVRFTDRDGIEQNAGRHAALCAIQSAALLTEQYRVAEALQALETASAHDPALEVPSRELHAICWKGSVAGMADLVLPLCDRALAQDPGNQNHRTARALALAVNGDLQGALVDLEAFLDWESMNERSALFQAVTDGLRTRSSEDLRATVSQWLSELRSGENPFTSELLADLRNRN